MTPTPDDYPAGTAALDAAAGELQDERLLAALRAYDDALKGGRQPNRQEFLARHADIAAELADCLSGLEFVHQAAPQLCPPSPPRAAPDLDRAQTFGDYRLVREIGRGGMGVVYEAVQLSLERRVALKVLPPAATLDPRHLQRFRNEAQAAAHLHHPHIVPVFAVGCEEGTHYYAMQLIEGRTLADLIGVRRRLAGLGATEPAARAATAPDGTTAAVSLPQTALPGPAERLQGADFFRLVARLGAQAAEALEYAHQLGVVHRDVKPANLLFDVRGDLWVTDFGVAHFRGDVRLTATGDVLGTLRYMSPEQASGRPVADPRSDVYALGATLYELLTLQPAIPARSPQEALEQIAHQEPLPPRRCQRAIPADLETIVLKALAKAPDDRYASARELADDLDRFLDDRPVRARRPGLMQRGGRWVQRHRHLAAAAVALLFVAVLVLAASTGWALWEEARTRAAYEAEARQRARAESNFRQARDVLDFFTQVSDEELAERPELEGLRCKLLEASLRYYEDFIRQQPDDPAVRAQLAESYAHVAALLEEHGSRAQAAALLEQARRLREQSPGPPLSPHGSGPSPGDFGAPPGAGLLHLLTQKPLQEELKLAPSQVEKIDELAGEWRDAPGRRGPRDRGPRLEALAATERALVELLQAEQVKRLRQILWQRRGAHALADPEIAQTLALTDAQKESVRSIENRAWGTRPAPPRHLPPAERRRQAEQFWEGVGDQLLQVLTPEQQTKWREMLGPPFRGDLRLGAPREFGGPPGPRGPPPHHPGGR